MAAITIDAITHTTMATCNTIQKRGMPLLWREVHDGFLPPAPEERAAASRRERARLAIRTVAERRALIGITAAAVVLGVLLYGLGRDAQYEGVAKLLIAQPESLLGQAPVEPDRLARTNLELIELETVAERVRRSLRVREREFTTAELLERVSVEVENDSDVLAIKARDEDPAVASALANGFAAQYVNFRKKLSRTSLQEAIDVARAQLDALSPTERRARPGQSIERRLNDLELSIAQQRGAVDIVKRAGVPSERVYPRPLLWTLLSLPAGMLLGLLAAGIVAFFDRRLKREEQVEAVTGLPVVASVPRRSEALVRRKGSGVWADPHEAEAYGRLATNLRFFEFQRDMRTVLVTSAVPQEGKTTVTLRLAAALAGAGQGVLAVEGDLRRPTFADTLGIQFPQGLSGVLVGATPFEDVLTRVHTSYALAAPVEEGDEAWTTAPYIEVLPAGVVPPNPGELLSSNALERVLRRARQEADVVLVDSAPLVSVGDAVSLASAVDGVLLVVQLGHSRRDEVRKALKHLGTLRAKVIGVVVTNAPRPDERYAYYGERAKPAPAPDPLGPRRSSVGRRRRPAPVLPEERAEPNGGSPDTEETEAISPERD
ncbi:MAG TPA: polysaccharide biosynthesis tyrosine autokinase [Thermoleophilaceae bacterium]|nr:polysaccharide biosynthesis tyrosine autokinase [Thermoleophilaceae bacterium]